MTEPVEAAVGSTPADASPSPAARIGAHITLLRRGRGLSLSELAHRAGIGKATLSGVEAGLRNPTLETLYAIAGQLGLPLAALLADPAIGSGGGVRGGAAPGTTGTPGAAVTGPGDIEAVHGAAVTARLLAVFAEPTAVFEFYELRIRPGRRQLSPPHSPGTTEHLTVHSGSGLVGPPAAPLAVAAGGYASWAGDEPHIFEAEDEVGGALLIRSPRSG